MWGGFAAKGKGKGKSKGGAAAPEGGKGHLLPKTRLSVEKFTGTVVTWKGKFGWIKPGEEIDHPKGSLHNGNLFCGAGDIVGAQALDQGATVEFHINEDSSGLGAEEIVVVGAPAGGAKGRPALTPPKGAKGGAAVKGGFAAKGGCAAPWGGKAGFGAAAGGAAFGKGAAKGFVAKGTGKPAAVITPFGKPAFGAAAGKGGKPAFGAAAVAGKGKGKGKDKGKVAGHLLPRERLSVEKFTGTVTAWKGKYGWITPSEEVEHEKASKHGGKLFVGKEDLIDVTELTPESVVEFHIWEDSSGLGADEVVVL